jgi:hypothetical protein
VFQFPPIIVIIIVIMVVEITEERISFVFFISNLNWSLPPSMKEFQYISYPPSMTTIMLHHSVLKFAEDCCSTLIREASDRACRLQV